MMRQQSVYSSGKVPANYFLLEFVYEFPVQKFKLLLTDRVSCMFKDTKLKYEARESDAFLFPLLLDERPKWIHVGTDGNSMTNLAAWDKEASIWSDVRKFQIFIELNVVIISKGTCLFIACIAKHYFFKKCFIKFEH